MLRGGPFATVGGIVMGAFRQGGEDGGPEGASLTPLFKSSGGIAAFSRRRGGSLLVMRHGLRFEVGFDLLMTPPELDVRTRLGVGYEFVFEGGADDLYGVSVSTSAVRLRDIELGTVGWLFSFTVGPSIRVGKALQFSPFLVVEGGAGSSPIVGAGTTLALSLGPRME